MAIGNVRVNPPYGIAAVDAVMSDTSHSMRDIADITADNSFVMLTVETVPLDKSRVIRANESSRTISIMLHWW